jgi:hypothetical protein
MPYYIYRVTERPIRQLAKIGELPSFKEASAEAKRLRAEGAEADGSLVKMIFAENELQAEDLLSQVREAPLIIGDDL